MAVLYEFFQYLTESSFLRGRSTGLPQLSLGISVTDNTVSMSSTLLALKVCYYVKVYWKVIL